MIFGESVGLQAHEHKALRRMGFSPGPELRLIARPCKQGVYIMAQR